ncbi:MAG: MFS transporter [Thermaerobacterales bacterium]
MSSRRKELYILNLTLFLTIGSFGMIFPLLPELLVEFGASAFHMGILVTGHALAQFISAPFWGHLSDRIGRKRVMMIGLVGFTISFVMMGMAHNFWVLLVARTLGGMLSAATYPTAHAYVADVTSTDERGPAMTSMGASMSLGMIGGPALGGALAFLGVRAAFFGSAVLVALTSLLAAYFLREPERRVEAGGGAVTAPRPAGPASTERRTGSLEGIALAVNSPYRLFFFLAFIVGFCHTTLFSLAGFYIHAKLDGSPVETSFIYIALGISNTVVQGLIVGRLIRRFGDEWTMVIGLACGTLGFGLLVLAGSLGQILAATLLSAVATACTQPTLASAISRRTNLQQGITMGVLSSFQSLGRMTGPLWGGWLFLYHFEAPFAFNALVYLITMLVAIRIFAAGPYGLEAAPKQPRAPAQPL